MLPIGKNTDLQRPTPQQWMLLLASVGIAGCSFATNNYRDLAFLGLTLVAINLVLVLHTAFEALFKHSPGKFLLATSCFLFFWTGVLAAALEAPSFVVSDALKVGGSQWRIDLLQEAFLYVTVFQFMLFVGYSLRPRVPRLVRWMRSRRDSLTPGRRILPYAFASLGLLTLLLSFRFDISSVVLSLLAMRSEGGPEGMDIGLLHYLDLLAFYGVALVFLDMFTLRHRATPKFLSIPLAAILILPAIARGTRHLTLFVMLPTLLLLLQRMPFRMTTARACRWIAIGLLLYALAQAQFVLRTSGLRYPTETSARDFLQLDAFGQFEALLYAEFLVPSHHAYFMELAEPYFLIHWIPREFWPEKPIMQSWLYYDTLFVGRGLYNVTPSVIGQFYLNWGFGGVVFIGCWLGILTALADRVLGAIDIEGQKAVGVTVGMFYAFLVSSFRFYHPLYFYYVVFGFLGMLVLTRHTRSVTYPDVLNRRAMPSLSHRRAGVVCEER